MTKTRSYVLAACVSLFVFILSGYLLVNLLRTGSVLSLADGHQKGVLLFDGDKKVGVNQAFSLRIAVDSYNQNVNAVGVFLRFDPDKIQVNEISTLQSFCQFYPEKKFDNRLGTVSLSCGAPHPGIKGGGALIELRLTPLAVGTTTIRATSDSKILLSDGKGTNILTDFPSWEVQIGAGL